MFSPHLKEQLDATDDRLKRQISILSWFFDQYDEHILPSNIVRYEEFIVTQKDTLSVLAYAPIEENEVMESKNNNPVYDWNQIDCLYDLLVNSNGSYWKFYSKNDVQNIIVRSRSSLNK